MTQQETDKLSTGKIIAFSRAQCIWIYFLEALYVCNCVCVSLCAFMINVDFMTYLIAQLFVASFYKKFQPLAQM